MPISTIAKAARPIIKPVTRNAPASAVYFLPRQQLSSLRPYSTPAPKPETGKVATTKNHPSPLGFVALAVAAFGAFAWISQKRHHDPEKHLREKRIPHPNPLIPPRSQEPQ